MYMIQMELIKTNEDLIAVCKLINKAKYITIDTEFIREKTYWSKLCLIQVCACLLYTSPSPRDRTRYRMPSSA